MTLIQSICTDRAPAPAGHYAQGVVFGELIFISGQLPIGPDGVVIADQSFESQARRVLANVFAILASGGSGPDRVLKITAYIAGVDHWPVFNRVYAEMFGAARPARSVVPVPALHYGCLVEIDAIAARNVPDSAA